MRKCMSLLLALLLFGCGVQKPVDDVLKPEEPTFIEGGTDNNEKNGEEIIYVDPAEKFRQLMSQSIAEISICRSYNIPNMFILHETLQSSESEQFIQILNSFTSVKNIDLQGKKFDEVYPSSERLTGNEIKVSFENESMDLYMFVSLYLYEDRAYFVTKNECYELKFENMGLLTGFIQQVLPVYWMSEEQYQQLKAEAPFADENSPECPSEEWFSFIDEEGLIKNRYYFKGNHDEDEDYDYQKALGVVNYMDPITASVNEFQYLFETAPKSSLFEARKEGEKTFLVGKGLKSSDPEYEMNKQSLKTEQGLNYYGIMKGNDFRTQYQSFFGKQGGLDESQTWFKKDSRRNTWGYIKEDDIYVYSPFYGAAGGGVRDYFYFIDELNQNGTEMTFQLAQIDCFVYNDPIVYDQWGVNVRSKDVPQLDASNTTYRELVNALPDSFARFELKLNKKDEGYEFISCQRLTPVPQLKMTDENYYTVYRDGIQFNISGNQAASINDEIRRNSDLALVKEDENMLELRTYHIYTSDQEFVQSKWLEKYFAQEIVYLLNKQTLEITRQ